MKQNLSLETFFEQMSHTKSATTTLHGVCGGVRDFGESRNVRIYLSTPEVHAKVLLPVTSVKSERVLGAEELPHGQTCGV